MGSPDLIHYASQAMLLVLYLSLPVIVAATLVGLLVGLFQALTQIQEQTLPFGIKLVAVILTLLFTAHWMGNEILDYADMLLDAIPRLRS